MVDVSDLVKRFGSAPAENAESGDHPFDDLVNRFGGTAVETAPPIAIPPPQNNGYPQPKTDAEILASQQNMPSNPLVQDIKAAPGYIANKGMENYKNAKELAGKGLSQIASGQPASGVGNAALGTIGAIAAYPSAVLSGIAKSGNKLGSDIGTKGVEVATSGLPIIKGAKITAANLIPSNRAVNKIIETVGPENLAEGLQRMRENPRLSPADVFPAVRSMAQGLATEVGPHQTTLLKAVEQRGGSAKSAVEGAYNETMGAPVNVLDKINTMKTNLRDIGAKEINPIVESSKPADITKLIKNIDAAIADGPIGAAALKSLKAGEAPTFPLSPTQTRLIQLRHELRGDWTDKPTMYLDVKSEQGLHRIQKDLRAEAQTLLESQGSDKLLGGKLMNFRNQIVSAVDAQHGGKYSEALGKYKDEFDIQNSFEKGQDILRNRPTKFEDRPELWAAWKKNASKEELDAAREGARLAVDQQINGMRFAAKKGTDIPEIDFNAQKLKLLFDEKEVNKLFKKLKDEKDIADTNSKIWQGSQTQFREGGQRAIAIRPDYQPNMSAFIAPLAEGAAMYATGGQSMGLAGGAVLGYQAARKGIVKAGQGLDRKTNNEIANLAVSTGQAREALMDALSNSLTKGKLTMAQKLQLALPTSP